MNRNSGTKYDLQRDCEHRDAREIAKTQEVYAGQDVAVRHLHCHRCGMFYSTHRPLKQGDKP